MFEFWDFDDLIITHGKEYYYECKLKRDIGPFKAGQEFRVITVVGNTEIYFDDDNFTIEVSLCPITS